MKNAMKNAALVASIVFLSSGLVFAKPKWTGQLGMKCKECHEGAAKKETATTEKAQIAKKMMMAMAKPKGPEAKELSEKYKTSFKGKKDCKDCHKKK